MNFAMKDVPLREASVICCLQGNVGLTSSKLNINIHLFRQNELIIYFLEKSDGAVVLLRLVIVIYSSM